MHDPDSRPMTPEEMDNFIALLEEREDSTQKAERAMVGLIILACATALVSLAILTLSGCGGSETSCRPDFVGPPSPNDTRPICKD